MDRTNGTPYQRWIEGLIDPNRAIENVTLKDIRDYQLKKIKETISYVKRNSIFYRDKLRNINSQAIDSFDDFELLVPFTSQRELAHKPLNFLCLPQHDISRIVTLKTSATSGKEKRIYFTQEDLERTVDFFHSGMNYLVDPGDRVLILLPGNYYGSIGHLLKKGLERMACKGIIFGPVMDEASLLDLLEKENIDCIVGIPIQIHKLARIKMSSRKYRGINLKSILLTADYVPKIVKTGVETAFSCKVLTHYGMTEMGFGGGVECKCKDGYHLREADIYFEIVDPISGEIKSKGREGELVFTTLTREGMPLIRYKTGDLASFKMNSCSCNQLLPRMDYVIGRANGGLTLDDISINIGILDEILFTLEDLLDYRVHIKGKEGRIILQIWTQSLNPQAPVTDKQIFKVIKASHIGFLTGKGRLEIVHKGEIHRIEPSTGMLKRKIII